MGAGGLDNRVYPSGAPNQLLVIGLSFDWRPERGEAQTDNSEVLHFLSPFTVFVYSHSTLLRSFARCSQPRFGTFCRLPTQCFTVLGNRLLLSSLSPPPSTSGEHTERMLPVTVLAPLNWWFLEIRAGPSELKHSLPARRIWLPWRLLPSES